MALLLLVMIAVHADTPAAHADTPAAHANTPRYNEVYQKSSHNSYEPPKTTLLDHLEQLNIHSLELDIHTGKGPGYPRDKGAWYVYHAYGVADDSTCSQLATCLDQLRAWHTKHPAHEVVTVFIDLKDAWDARHAPGDLDAALARALPGAVYGPRTAKAACQESSLRTALTRCAWPELATLRGKFMFVLTGTAEHLAAYAKGSDLAYIAPLIATSSEIAAFPDAVFFNLNSENYAVGRAVMAAGFVSRAFYRSSFVIVHGINDITNWRLAVMNSINHIATDEIDPTRAPWSSTANANGWPFTCLRQDCSGMRLGTARPRPLPPRRVRLTSVAAP